MSFRSLDLGVLRDINRKSSREVQVYMAAIHYAECGFYIVPNEKGSKRLPRKDYNINYGSASRKKETMEKWFHPDYGKFKGWNVGIACGRHDGVFAVDIDKHGSVDGFKGLRRLETEFGSLPEGPCQNTPNGGKHFLFQWQENGSNTTNKIADGIDTRGGTDNACKGHITVWPSETMDGQYKWESGGVMPETPMWIIEKMGVLWQPVKYMGEGRGNENLGEEDFERVLPKQQVERMLSHIEIDTVDYEAWLKVGMAIKSQYPNDDGLEIWDGWSKTGTRYKNEECKIRWHGFSVSGSVRAGTLFYYAKENGYNVDPEQGDRVGSKFDELVARMNEEFAIVSVGGKIRILREKLPEVDIMTHYDLMDKDSFRTLLANELITVIKDGKPKLMPVTDVWLSHQHRRTYANGMGLYPDGAPNGYYNTWNGFAVQSRPGDCSLFLSHVEEIICHGDKDIYCWVMDWLADLVQDPANPKGCAVVMRGGEGVGKGTFANTIGELFGPHYRHLIDDSHLTNNFNAHLMDAIVVFADEITWGGDKKSSGKLKGMVTERNLVGERKTIDALMYRNLVHMFVASNNRWLIPAGGDSRRWLVLDVNSAMANGVNYFNSVQDELDNGGKEALLHELENREITSNLRRAPETEALQEQRMMSAQSDTIAQWWEMAVESGKLDVPDEREFEPGVDTPSDWPEMVDKVSLYNNYEDWCQKRRFRPMGMNIFFKDVKRVLSIENVRTQVGNVRKRVFKIRPLDKIRSDDGVED